MKVAVVLSEFPCNDEVFILRELRGLERHGIDLRIYSLKPAAAMPLHADAKALLEVVKYSPLFLSREVLRRNAQLVASDAALYLELLLRIIRETWRSQPFFWRSLALFPEAVRWGMELREDPAERIHAHWATHPGTAAWVMSEVSKIPLSFTAHAHDIYVDQSMLAFKLREAVTVLTCTRQNVEFLKQLAPDLPDDRIRLAYHGLDLDVYRPAAASPEVFRILSVGTLLPRKGFDTLVDACAALARQGVEFECRIVGDGPLRASLEQQTRRLGLGQVHFLGMQSQESLPEIYRSSSVFVFPAVHGGEGPPSSRPAGVANRIHFGIPNVILEAMASGLPVVTTRLPALAEVVDEEDVIYVPERDPSAVASAIRRLVDAPDIRTRMGKRAVERMRFTFDGRVTIAQVVQALAPPTDDPTLHQDALPEHDRA